MKRKKYQSNKALALFLCVAVLLFSIGLAMARGERGTEPYKTTDLVLTQGDRDYDLTSGISYDASKYTLAVTDQGYFDINTPGTYVVGYTLTPITGSAVTPAPSNPVAPPSTGDQTQGKTPAANPEGTKPDTSKPAPTKPDVSKPDTSKPAPTKPDVSKPDTSKPDSSKPDTSKPAPTKPDVSKPDTSKPDSSKPDIAKPDTSKPAPTKPDVSKPDTAKPDTLKPAPTKPDVSKPDTTQPDSSKPDTTKPDITKPDTAPASDKTPKSISQPDFTPNSTSSDDGSGSASAKSVSAKTLAASNGKGALFLSTNLLTGTPGYGTASPNPDPAMIAAASKPDSSKSEGGSASSASKAGAPSAGNESGKPDAATPSTGEQSAAPGDSDSQSDHPSPAPGASDSQAGDQNGAPGDGESLAGDPTRPATPDSQAGDSTDGSDTAKPPTGDASEKPSAPETGSQAGPQTGGASGIQTPAAPEDLKAITFTRSVVVNPAVEYQNIRLDVSNAAPGTEEISGVLLSSMKFDDKKYSVKVTDDGHFFADRIGEYKVTYELAHAEDGDKIADLERYVWVTAPGVTFEAQPLTVDTSKDYDLLADIQYDSGKYDLSLVDPNAFDVSTQEPQRVMYRLTLRSESKKTGKAKAVKSEGEQTDNTESVKADEKTAAEAASPSGVEDQPGSDQDQPGSNLDQPDSDQDQTGQLVAAVFGREVTSNGGHSIQIDAPPLIITQGAVQTVNLLEGVTVKDEKGNPVQSAKPMVLDRSHLDNSIQAADAAAKDESQPKQETEAATPSAVTDQISPDQPNKAEADSSSKKTDEAASQPDKTAAAASSSEKENEAADQAALMATLKASPFPAMSFMRSLPNLGAFANTDPKKESKAAASTAGAPNGKAEPSAADTAGAATKPSAADTAGAATKPSAADTTEMATTTSAAVTTGGAEAVPPASTGNPPIIDLSENVTLPANLSPGTYTVLLGAANPATGVLVKKSRLLELRAGTTPVTLLGSDGSLRDYMSLGQAFKDIQGRGKKGTQDKPFTYTIQINKNITFDPVGDQKMLSAISSPGPYTTIVLTGKSGGIYPNQLNLSGRDLNNRYFSFPITSDYETSPKFVLREINLTFQVETYLVANGSQVTIDTGTSLAPAGNQGFNFIGGGMNASVQKGKINTNIIIKDGRGNTTNNKNYSYVCGGNWAADTNGTTHVTVDIPPGNKTNIDYLYGGGGNVTTSAGNFTQTGDSYLTFKGGNFGGTSAGTLAAFGGSRGPMNGNSTVVLSGGRINGNLYGGSAGQQLGTAKVTVTGGDVAGTVFGGCSGGTLGTAAKPTSSAIVEMSGGTANTLQGCGGSDTFGTSKLTLTGSGIVTKLVGGGNSTSKCVSDTYIGGGGTVNTTIWGSNSNGFGSSKMSQSNIYLNSNQSVDQLQYFDNLTLGDHKTLTVTGKVLSYDSTGIIVPYNGKIHFGTDSVLSLQNSFENFVGNLYTTGKGARLELTRQASRDKASLSLSTVDPVGITTSTALTLKFVGKNADQVDSGDLALKFINKGLGVKDYPNAVNTGVYAPDFPRGLFLQGNKANGNVRVSHGVGLQVGSDINAPVTYYGSVAAALNDVGTGPEYRVSIRKQNYSLTLADGVAIATKGGGAGHITYTGGFTATAVDPLEPGESVGKGVIRTVLIGSDPSLQAVPDLKPDISFTTDTTVEHLKLEYSKGGGSIYANGHRLVVGDGVEINSDSSLYPSLYGGAPDAPVTSTYLELHSGNFKDIYGGGKSAKATAGSTTVSVISGRLFGTLYGGGQDGNVIGKATVDIRGGELMAATPTGGENRVVGGGATGDVGSCDVSITGGKAYGKTEVAGCYHGNVTGDVSISITREPKAGDPGTTVPAADIYGGSVQVAGAGEKVGTVGGAVSILLNGGEDYRIVSGGGRPVEASVLGSYVSTVAGSRSITITSPDGKGVQAKDVVDFDQFNLGVEKSNTVTMTILGALDSNLGASGSFGRTGDLNFYRGSKLNLKGKTDSPKVRDITVDSGAEASHLHIHKGGDVTNPMYVSGQIRLSGTTRLVLGVLDSAGTGGGADGDRLLVFADASKIDDSNYLGDSPNLAIIHDGDTVMYGKPAYPTAKLMQAEPAALDTAGDSTPIKKKLSFEFSTKDRDGSIGAPLDSAYVSTDPVPYYVWAQSDGSVADLPPALQSGIVKNIKQDPKDPTRWTGEAELLITPTTSDKPIYYYLQVKCKDYTKHATVILDVNAPTSVKTTQVSRDGDENYNFTLTIQDGTPPTPPDKPEGITYTASGLYEAGWYVGDTSPTLPDTVLKAAVKPSMDTSVIHGVTDLSEHLFETPEVKLQIPKDQLLSPGETADDLKNKVVYFFLKDQAGNTSQMKVPMSESLIDVTIPLRVGVIAMHGGDSASVTAPVCNVVNNGNTAVEADLVEATIEKPKAPAKAVTLVTKHADFSPDEINLQITPVVKEGEASNSFFSRSIIDISQKNPLKIGIIPKRTEGVGEPYVNFTFAAQFDQRNIIYTDAWSACKLTYCFKLTPEAPESKAGSASSDADAVSPGAPSDADAVSPDLVPKAVIVSSDAPPKAGATLTGAPPKAGAASTGVSPKTGAASTGVSPKTGAASTGVSPKTDAAPSGAPPKVIGGKK